MTKSYKRISHKSSIIKKARYSAKVSQLSFYMRTGVSVPLQVRLENYMQKPTVLQAHGLASIYQNIYGINLTFKEILDDYKEVI
jgi:hypothetical protein